MEFQEKAEEQTRVKPFIVFGIVFVVIFPRVALAYVLSIYNKLRHECIT